MWRMPVLVALNPADTARQLEAMTDAEVIADAMAVRGPKALEPDWRCQNHMALHDALHGSHIQTSDAVSLIMRQVETEAIVVAQGTAYATAVEYVTARQLEAMTDAEVIVDAMAVRTPALDLISKQFDTERQLQYVEFIQNSAHSHWLCSR
jgi:hypothetical protein